MSNPTETEEIKAEKPTTVRISATSLRSLENIARLTKLTKNALIGLAIDSFIDFSERTGKLPVPKLQRRKPAKGGPRD